MRKCWKMRRFKDISIFRPIQWMSFSQFPILWNHDCCKTTGPKYVKFNFKHRLFYGKMLKNASFWRYWQFSEYTMDKYSKENDLFWNLSKDGAIAAEEIVINSMDFDWKNEESESCPTGEVGWGGTLKQQ